VNPADTIVAVSSPPGRAQRGIVRMSGSSALAIAGLEGLERGCHHIRLELDGRPLPAIAVVALGPASFTGEDVLECLVPGGELLLTRLIESFHHVANARGLALRSAEPGEFTARAYLNARIDLLEAEGIGEAIRAETDSHLRAANLMSRGGLGSIAGALVDELTRLTALVEAGIDFTDQEDVVAISNPDLAAALVEAIGDLERRLDDAVAIERLESVPRVVLAGAANAGKSSLFNRLIGRERTVVAPVRGTTRDVVVEPLQLETDTGELEILLSDLAGFEPDDVEGGLIEESMQRVAREAIEQADLVVRCTPPATRRIDLPAEGRVLDITTRSDLPGTRHDVLEVSIVSGAGLEELRKRLTSALGATPNVLSAGVFALSLRHRDTLTRTLDSMRESARLLGEDGSRTPPVELVAACLRDTLDALGELVGRVTPDAVLEHVFARFCVGK